MKKKTGIIVCACIALVAILVSVAAIFIFHKEEKDMTIKCMSFNILGVEGYEGYLPVEIRAQHLQTYLNESGMDLIGLQEAGSHDYDWQNFFIQRLERDGVYKAVCIGNEKAYDEQARRYPPYPPGRVSNSAGLIILYKPERFELLESGSQRYTSTELQERHYQWAKFTDTYTGETVFMTNTHWSINWDEHGQYSLEAGNSHRTKEANELRTFWEEKVGDSLLFATGDYNARQNTEWIQSAAKGIYKPVDIIMGNEELHIDHIFLNTERVEIVDYKFLNDRIVLDDGEHRYSDHDPFVVTVKIKDN